MYYMEENLNMPLRQVLAVIQDRIMKKSTYFGVQAQKGPIDAWIYQELIFEIKPDIIVEIGNAHGGSTLFLAHICDLLRKGKVIALDLSHSDVPRHVLRHRRIKWIEGDACENFKIVAKLIRKNEKVLIIEDSSHTYENTLNILRLYSPLVTKGSYFVIEDGICHHGLEVGPNPGPYEAISTFINENKDFEIDRGRESFLITWNPRGYLKRK